MNQQGSAGVLKMRQPSGLASWHSNCLRSGVHALTAICNARLFVTGLAFAGAFLGWHFLLCGAGFFLGLDFMIPNQIATVLLSTAMGQALACPREEEK